MVGTSLRVGAMLAGLLLALGWAGCDSGTTDTSGCESDVQCDDGDPCTRDSCDPSGDCRYEAIDVAVECDDGNPCTLDACTPGAGCVHDGTDVDGACDDGDPCTTDDACQGDEAGSCLGATPVECDDANPCTADSCDPSRGCVFHGAGLQGPCDDDDVCTHDDVCQGDTAGTCAGTRQPAEECDDGDPCTADVCDPAAGCQHTTEGVTVDCDDGNPCTAQDSCQGDGTCLGTVPTDCDDGNSCTADSCDPATGCVHDGTGITDPCDDNSVCTHDDACHGDAAGTCAGTFQPATACDDQNVCTVDTCHPRDGCVHDGTGITRGCDDGDACTAGDVCRGDGAGTCLGEDPVDCDDQNACTADSCDPGAGCVNDGSGIAGPCDDQSVCTIDDACQGDAAGTCAGTDVTATLCDDGNDCTADSCDPLEGCSNELEPRHECFPVIVVTYPPRGATIQGPLADPVVTVTGSVTSGAGPVTAFLVNGVDVPLNSDGTFSHPVQAAVGGNALRLEATDSMDSYRKRVQAFLYSDDYRKPEQAVPGSGMVEQGMGIWLAQEVLDDGDHSLPPDDLATIFEIVLNGLDLGDFFDPGTPIASEQGWDIYLTDVDFSDATASLTSIDGGMQVHAAIVGIDGDLYFDCTCTFCGCWFAGGDSTGGMSVSSITIDADVLLSVNADHTLHVQIANAQTHVNNLDIWSNDWWTDFIIGIIWGFIEDGLVADLESELNNQLTAVLAPMLEDALGALAVSQTIDLPRLDGSGGVITILLQTDFWSTGFDPSGGRFILRTGATTTPATPYDNLGVPMRSGCGSSPQAMVLPGAYPFELGLADDTLNELFYAAWHGGLLEFPIPPDMLGIGDLAQYGIENLSLTLSGMLAPTATDCNPDGELRIFLGDLQLLVSLEFNGIPMDFIVWANATMGLVLDVVQGEITVSITEVEAVDTELVVVQDELVGLIDLVGDSLENVLIDALMQALGGGQLASFPLPEIDLSAALPSLPPGTVIALDPQDVSRIDGNTIIGGDLQ